MIIGRLLAGIGIGISSTIVPLYISEVVTSKTKIVLTHYRFIIRTPCNTCTNYLMNLFQALELFRKQGVDFLIAPDVAFLPVNICIRVGAHCGL